MGGVAVLHPRDCLNDNRDNLFLSPVKSRRNPKSTPNLSTSNPNLTRSDARKRSPPTGLRKHKSPATMVTDPPATAAGKALVMGQVKILKRGEPLDDLSTVLKDLTDRSVTNETATTAETRLPEKEVASDRKVKRVTPVKKKSEGRSFSNPKMDDFALSSTERLGPDPEMVPKQMKGEFFFAGSAFVDSPPPSSLPLPGFFTKNFGVKEDPTTDLRRMLGVSSSRILGK
ncbi:hypothetical protein HanXRQr2_Chr16g0746351 [Helianthus annuus]|uniref:Uncharacterized protein n=1 Tax=Helianthus annuus TaxID=4232 RepID=A0A9K3GXP8_HELAN|nr:hypothetical protein HanXRQr2_Chr16g0746351 [Helianthus annuus]KAJ0437974.1 hypothetical protein HanHA300_Chr16g0608571 [Helianthus annuus]KAJ0460304.1 hypothetical protein HanHA89_Chr16g0659221 [Helianthus annuus]KAJ0640746.1 hypothetical protein HanLR1_Chr16g0619201 [Helianthus annuus]